MIDCDQDRAGGGGIVAAVFATVGTRWNLGLPRLVFSPEAPNHARIAGRSSSPTATPVSWCSTGAWWRANPLGMLWPEMHASSGEDDRGGRSVTVAQRPRGVGELH